ncbi:MAG: hypothetical protein IK083_09205 [Abditibacteriota bacterium]|nr:hypothetical protein [Abditibacteriota bacterium]
MKAIDIRFSAKEMGLIKRMIGKKMVVYKHDPLEFSTSVYGLVGLLIEDESFAFTNFVEKMDYYGENEDVAVFRIKAIPFDEIKSKIQSQQMIEMPVNDIIAEIDVVNEHQKLYRYSVQTYDVMLTRGIIFRMKDGNELSFEKNIWFSENISVEKGYDLIKRFSPTDEFSEGWSGEYKGVCSREIIKIL